MSKQKSTSHHKNRVFSAVDKMPFAGKFLVKDVYVGFDTASDKRKTLSAIGATAFLSAFSYVHARQGYLGVESLIAHAPGAVEGDSRDALLGAYDVVYTAGMAAVAARQAELTRRVVSKYVGWRKEKNVVPESERRKEKRPYRHKAGAMLGAFAFTLAAQAVEMGSMYDAHTHQTHQSYSSPVDESYNHTQP